MPAELADELVVDAALDDAPGWARCRSGRSGRPTCSTDVGDDGLEVGVVEHDGRALAAQLEQQALHLLAGRPRRCGSRRRWSR